MIDELVGLDAKDLPAGVKSLARLGYAARGVIYLIIGFLAAALAFGWGQGDTTGTHGALRTIASQPLGSIALGLIAFGLAGYALWRAYQAVTNPERRGSEPRHIARRLGYGIRAVTYGALAWGAAKLALGKGGSGAGDNQEELTAKVFSLPLGRWIVVIVGVILIGYGLSRLKRAWGADLPRELGLERLPVESQGWIVHVSRFGIGARGVVFGILGWFLAKAGFEHQASEAGGTSEALSALRSLGQGGLILGVVALGLIAFGVYSLLEARYRRM